MNVSRRRFLRTASAGTLAAPWIGWSSTSKGGSPSREIRFANFGAAGRAWSDLKEMLEVDGATLAAFAEVDTARAARAREDHSDAAYYRDWRKLFDERAGELDAVVIGTPDHMHAPIAMTAMQLGLPVYCEKPLTRTLHECRRAREVAEEKDLVTQMGIQVASTPGNRTAVHLLREGIIGKVTEVHSMNPKSWGSMDPLPEPTEPPPETLNWDHWIGVGRYRQYIPREFHPSQWRKRIGYGTGTLGDMGCHIYHPWFMGLGQPETISVTSHGPAPVDDDSWPLDGLVKHRMKGTDRTDGDFDFTWYDGAQKPGESVATAVGGESNVPRSGSVVIGETGVLVIPHGSGGKPILYRDGQVVSEMPAKPGPDGKPVRIEGTPDEPIEMLPKDHHHGNFAAAIRGEIDVPARTNFSYSGPMTETVLLGTVAMRLPAETLEWDAEAGRFSSSESANELLHEPYRDGWEVAGI